ANYLLEKESGNPVDVICEKAKLADMLILGARGEFAKWSDKMLGATLEAITRLSIKPVFISPKEHRNIKRIMIAYDGSENSNKALTLAAFFTSKLNLPLLLLNVNDSEDSGKKTLQEAKDYLAPYQLSQLDEKIIPGDATAGIVTVSKQENIDLIIMGSYGHSRIREAILGSTTVQTMRQVTIPVLMAR
ncbi:MAG: universal stress protein, partial [bacterium]